MRNLPLITGTVIVAIAAFLLGRHSMGPGPAPRAAQGDNVARRQESHPDEVGGGGSEQQGRDGEGDRKQGVVKFEAASLPLAHLRVEPVAYYPLGPRLAVTGTVGPNLTGVVKVTPRVAGKVTSIQADVGADVRSGQPLATLASTELAQVQASYRQAEARVAVTGSSLQRQRKLAALGEFASPSVEEVRRAAVAAEGEVSVAQGEVAAATAGVAEGRSRVRALQAGLAQAQTQVKVTASRLQRADALLKAGIFSRQSWEQAQADDERAQADVEAAQANIAEGQAQVQTAKANLTAAAAKLTEARRRRDIAARALAREEAVYQGGYMTNQAVVEAEAAWQQAQAEQRAAADSIRLLGGTPGGGNVLIVTAPLGGRVTERLVTLGETVTPETPLFTVMDLRTVWAQLDVYPRDLPAVRMGERVTIAADTAPGRVFSGVISYVGDLVDETTRTAKVRAVIRNAGSALRPLTFVRGTIAGASRTPRLAVPRDAVQSYDGKTVVFVQGDHPGEFVARAVRTGDTLDGRTAVTAGLQAGDRVVTRGAFMVKAQGMKSELKDTD